MFRLLSAAMLCIFLIALSGPVAAQTNCNPQWLPGEGVPGTSGTVYATTMWDPDGAGPQSPRLVAGGYFRVAGDALANMIATYDFTTGRWSSLDSGMTLTVSALAVLPDGSLVAAGWRIVNGVTVNGPFRWNGSSWLALGSGTSGLVHALAVLPNGNLVAGGDFLNAGGVTARRVAIWNGTAWSSMGSGMDDAVEALAVLPGGDLVAGGAFTTAGGVSANHIARWDGVTWSPLGSGTSDFVSAIKVLHSGDLVAGGEFTTAGGVSVNRIARWDGVAWSPLGTGMTGSPQGSSSPFVQTLAVLPDGDLVAGGYFTTAGGIVANFIGRWNGSLWSSLGSGVDSVVSSLMVLPDGDLVAGGSFSTAGSVGVAHIARWNGAAWSALGSPTGVGFNHSVDALTTLPDGGLVAAGHFTTAGGASANHVARWNGSTWLPLGSGMSGGDPLTFVRALTALPNGHLIAGGSFTTAGGELANSIAQWDGFMWTPLGSGVTGGDFGQVSAVAVLPNGDLIAGGSFTTAGGLSANRIARWDGSSWSPLGSGMNNAVWALAVLPNGDLVAGGGFTTAGGVTANRIARWDGSAWSPLGTGMSDSVYALTVEFTGTLVAGGTFMTAGGVTANRIARWDGSSWLPLGLTLSLGWTGYVYALAALPDGDLIVGGDFIDLASSPGDETFKDIARGDGVSWSSLDSGTGASSGYAYVGALAVLPNGDMAVGGYFTTIGGQLSAYFARYGLLPGCRCDTIDFNHDTLFPDPLDIADFLSVFSGGVCDGQTPGDPPCNTDIDFNNDTLFPDTDDIGALLRVFSGGACV